MDAAATDTADLPMHLREALETEREPGEQLLWVGQPDPLRAVRTEWGAFLFAIPWTGFALFWEAMALGLGFSPKVGTPQPVAWFFALFGLPFVGIGIAMLAAPFVAMAKARQTVYAVTNKRVLILEHKGKGRESRSVVPRYVGDLQRTERGDGSGNLTIAHPSNRYGNAQGQATENVFWGVKNVRRVERLVREVFFAETDGSAPTKPSFGVGAYQRER
ncbi:MAG: hypothetical protein H8F28_15205 [Fibrella sp.]|nr:hypothetical protein [Armatimonadota bacterium]